MRFQKDERVRVHYKRYPDQPPGYHEGTYVRETRIDRNTSNGRVAETAHYVRVYGVEMIFTNTEVYHWRQLDQADIDEWGRKNAPKLRDLIAAAMTKLIPVENQIPAIIEGEWDVCIEGVYGVVISPVAIERKSIGQIIEVHGWQVTTSVLVPGYPHSPDDVDIKEEGEAPTNEQTAALAIEVYWRELSRRHWESIEESKLADAMLADREEQLSPGYLPPPDPDATDPTLDIPQ